MNAKEIKQRLKTGQPVEKWQLANLIQAQEDEIKLLRQGMKAAFDGLETITAFSKVQASIKPLTVAIDVIKDFQNSDVPPCKDYENTYDDGWMDACNEILWAIQEKVDDK